MHTIHRKIKNNLLGVKIAVALGGCWLMNGMELKACAAFLYECWLHLCVQFLKFHTHDNCVKYIVF